MRARRNCGARRMALRTASPSITGSWISSSTTWGRKARAASRAAPPSLAEKVSHSCPDRNSINNCRLARLSSTTRILGFNLAPRSFFTHWYGNRKLTALVGRAANGHATAQPFRQAPHHGQPQARSLGRYARPQARAKEFLEDGFLLLGGNSHAGIDDADGNFAALALCRDSHRAIFRSKFYRVAHQVQQNLAQPRRIRK